MYYTRLYLALALAGYSDAFFRMSCPGRLVRERIDPVVDPGKISRHVHTVSGGSGWSPNMTFEDARSATCTSCEITEDLSNYWTPQLYVRLNTQPLTFKPVPVVGDPEDGSGGMTVYYLQRRGDPNERLTAFPEGFRMLAGDNLKRNLTDDLPARGISFACLGSDKPETNGIPNYRCPGGLRAQVFFPSCWNGKDLDSPNHKSHMSYPNSSTYDNGPCPAEYPVHMVSIFYEILYDTALFDNQWTSNDQHPFVFANGDATGYGFHGDFFNGWNISVLQNAIDNCNASSGLVSECGAVTQQSASDAAQCRLYSTVAETVDGTLSSLPGCNSVTFGPERATIESCSDATTFGAGPVNYIDLTSSKKWEYVGCGKDNIGDRALNYTSTSNDNMTVTNCIDFCLAGGYAYAGLENSRECFCGKELQADDAPKPGIMGDCGFKCAGDSSQTCGGWGTLSIYHDCAGQTSCSNVHVGSRVTGQTGMKKARHHARQISM